MITAAEARSATNKKMEELTEVSWKSIEQRVNNAISSVEFSVTVEFPISIKDCMFKKLTEAGFEYNNRAGNVQHNGKYAIKISW